MRTTINGVSRLTDFEIGRIRKWIAGEVDLPSETVKFYCEGLLSALDTANATIRELRSESRHERLPEPCETQVVFKIKHSPACACPECMPKLGMVIS